MLRAIHGADELSAAVLELSESEHVTVASGKLRVLPIAILLALGSTLAVGSSPRSASSEATPAHGSGTRTPRVEDAASALDAEPVVRAVVSRWKAAR